jgi:tetratricopeptide (TPR) repeat protein
MPGPSPEDLQELRSLYERGLCLRAFEAAQKFGDLSTWPSTEGRVLAGRLAMNLGAGQLGWRLHFRAYRHDRRSHLARYYFALVLFEFRGPLATWDFLAGCDSAPDITPGTRANMCALRARAAAKLRDFETAELWLKKADDAAPGKAWNSVERAGVLAEEDRPEEALEVARLSLKQHFAPWYRPAVQQVAHLLQVLGRETEAIEFLQEACAQLESAPVAGQLYALLIENDRFEQAARTLDRYEQLSPMLDEPGRQWLAGQRVRIAYLTGERLKAADLAEKIDDPIFKDMALRLRDDSKRGRVRLNVEFVRQNYQTCAPATIATLGRFWKMPADHLAVAQAICYDGTPIHVQRTWATQNGWSVREWTVTWESARALLDRGVPFVITTVDPGNAHAQAVTGYDELRQSLFIRDPSQPFVCEVLVEPFLKRYESSGPRGMALVPVAQSALLDGINLPESELSDQVHAIQAGLARHDRPAAVQALDALQRVAPDHRLFWDAKRDVAIYDGNQDEVLRCVETILEKFPDDANWQLAKLSCLRDGPREKRVAFLEAICRSIKADPLLWQQYAVELSVDARESAAGLRHLGRSLRFRPVDAASFCIKADILWQRREFEKALELYRFAACLENKKEGFARSYFTASRHLRKTDVALVFLENRFRRFGDLSAFPSFTLIWALGELNRINEAFDRLEKALRLRPEDGDLARYAAEEYARWNRNAEAAACLKNAEGKSHRTAWLRSAAAIASYASQPAEALKLWREVLALEPLAVDAHRAVAQLLAETEGRAAALDHLAKVCAERPHSCALHQVWIDWIRDEGAAQAEPVVRRLLALNPLDIWCRRELALALAEQRKADEALAEASHAIELEPSNTWNYSTRARVHLVAHRIPEAKADARRAIELSADNTYAISLLVDLCSSHKERKEALEFVESELVRQVVLGDGLLAFYESGRSVLEPGDLLNLLRRALQERPDLWQAHSTIVIHLTNMGLLDEALACAREATTRFPLSPRLWMDMARVFQARRDAAAEREALEKAVQINSAWSQGVRALAELYERQGDLEKARATLEQAVARDPLDPVNRGTLAELLWKIGRKPEALRMVQQAACSAPGYDWAWNALRHWARELKQPDLPVEAARQLTATRAGDALSWLRLGEMLALPETLNECFAVLDKALALNPRCEAAYEQKIFLLTREHRFDEALALCNAPAWNGAPPLMLRGRAAWVEAERGNTVRAIEQMRAVLSENPDFYWGWRELADWHWRAGAMSEALEAAKTLVRLAPLNPVPLGYLAGIKLRMDDRAGAKADFRRAVELDPQYSYAGLSLFDMFMEDGQFSEAGELLEILKLHARDEWVLAREVQLASAQKDHEKAFAVLEELCGSQQEDAWPLSAALQAASSGGWPKAVRKLLKENFPRRGSNPNLAAFWVEYSVRDGKLRCLRPLRQLRDEPEKMKRGVTRYLEMLAQHYQRCATANDLFGRLRSRALLARTMREHRDWLGADDQAWGKVGYALITMGLRKRTVQWLGDWRRRKGVEPWMLYNLMLAFQQRGDAQGAREVIASGLQLAGRDAAIPSFRLNAALDAALSNDYSVASALIKEVIPEQLEQYDKQLHNVVTMLLLFIDGGPKPKFSKEHRVILGAFLASNQANRCMTQSFTRASKLIAQQTGTRRPVIWAWWRRFNPVVIGSLVALVLILSGLASALE